MELALISTTFAITAEVRVGRLCWRVGLCERYDALGDVRSQRRDARWPRLVARETVITFLHERSCQRRTQVFDLPVRRMISLVPTPSALNRTISARQTCLCGALRSRASASVGGDQRA
jgi:hypothetical protein